MLTISTKDNMKYRFTQNVRACISSRGKLAYYKYELQAALVYTKRLHLVDKTRCVKQGFYNKVTYTFFIMVTHGQHTVVLKARFLRVSPLSDNVL